MYAWRKMSPEERESLLEHRKARSYPWHSPPHQLLPDTRQYIITAACYEHAPVIGATAERMDELANLVIETANQNADEVFAWCVLPNHYHLVLQTSSIELLLAALGLTHGRTSFRWNGEDGRRGRKVWCNAFDREMRSDRHLWASINYTHHNAVKHGYVDRWQDWPWSSARNFLDEEGHERATYLWREYPVLDYGDGWDD